VQVSRGFEDLGVANRDDIAHLAPHHEANPARDVLAGVELRGSVAVGAAHRQLGDGADGRRRPWLEAREVRFDDVGVRPRRVVEAPRVHALGREAKVDVGAVVDARGAGGSEAAAPRGVGRHQHAVLRVDLGERARAVAVDAGAVGEAHAPAVPAVADLENDRVGSLAQQAGHVDRVDEHAVAVGGPARREVGVARAHSVDPGVDEAECREAQTGALRQSRHRELAPQQRGRPLDLGGDADDLGPVRIESGLDHELVAPGGPAVLGRDAHREGVPLARGDVPRGDGDLRGSVDHGSGNELAPRGPGGELVGELRHARLRGDAPGEPDVLARHAEEARTVLGAERDDARRLVELGGIGDGRHGSCPFAHAAPRRTRFRNCR
jgi:hypothetical protein